MALANTTSVLREAMPLFVGRVVPRRVCGHSLKPCQTTCVFFVFFRLLIRNSLHACTGLWATYYTPELAEVNFHWEIPLKSIEHFQ